eukprot:GHVR01040656.1.p1 GENE.GHVR01040656.1~~GHVR01040656.1.p1  ORF type:complete len:101 (-),score=2.79 GHVR01040656.1:771-1073(-)
MTHPNVLMLVMFPFIDDLNNFKQVKGTIVKQADRKYYQKHHHNNGITTLHNVKRTLNGNVKLMVDQESVADYITNHYRAVVYMLFTVYLSYFVTKLIFPC